MKIKSVNIIRATLMVSLLSFLGKIMGFVREVGFASIYGISSEMDAYVVAAMIPTFIGSLLQDSIIAALLPIYKELYNNDKLNDANRLVSKVILVTVGFFLLISWSIMQFSEPLVAQLCPGFSQEKQILTCELLTIMLPCILFYGFFGILSALQQANHQFMYPSLSSLPFNLVILIFIVVFSKQYGVYAAAVATLLGVFSQMLLQLLGVKTCCFSFRILGDKFFDLHMKRVGQFIVPILLGILVANLTLLVDRKLASQFNDGGVAALNYANRLNVFFIGFLVSSIITVIFPAISQAAAEQNLEKVRMLFSNAVRMILFIIAPLAVFICVFREEIIRVLFQRGNFDESAVQQTAMMLLFYTVGVLGTALLDLFNKTFYAQKETSIPFKGAFFIAFCNIFLDYVLVYFMGIYGISLANAVAITMGIFYLYINLKKKMEIADNGGIIKSGLKSLFAATFMGITLWFFLHYVRFFLSSAIVILIIGSIFASLVYYFISDKFRSSELIALIEYVKQYKKKRMST